MFFCAWFRWVQRVFRAEFRGVQRFFAWPKFSSTVRNRKYIFLVVACLMSVLVRINRV